MAADVVGQLVLGAADAALQGQDPGIGAAGAAASAEALTGGGASSSKPGLRGTAAAAGKALVKQGIKALTSKGGA